MSVVQSRNGAAAVDRHMYAAFVAAVPKILNVAGYRFRRISCPDTREDCVRETVALCWVWFVRLVQKGRNPDTFLTALATYGAKAVHCGRRACDLEKAKDVLSRRCQRRRGFAVASLHELADADDPLDGVLADALTDNTSTPVPDQVQFRCDFPAWKSRLPEAKGRLVDMLALGHRTKDVAAALGLSEGRISQLRKEFNADYTTFCEGTVGG